MTTTTFQKAHPKAKFYSRHTFSPAIKQQIKVLHPLDNWHGILQVLEDWLWIAVAILCSTTAWEFLPSFIAVLIYAFAVLVIGARQRGLRVNNHQATHKALAKNTTLNWLLGTVFAAWTALESFSGFDDTHNSKANGHHFNLGTTQDVDHMAVVATGLYDEEVSEADIRRYLWSIPFSTPKYVIFLLFNRILNPRENLWERIVRLIYFSALSGLLIYFGYGQEFILYWLVPLFTTSNWIGSFIQLAEHYPLMATARPLDLSLSRNRILSPLSNFFVGTHQEGYHLIHHLYPKMPLWNMRKAHQILMQDPDYAAVHKRKGMNGLIQDLTER